MKVCHGFILNMVMVSIILLPISSALSTSITGRTRTVVEWYDDADEDTAVPLYQYLQLSVTDIAAKGYSFKGYGRLGEDVNNEVDAESRLYYAYLEKKDLIEGLDFRLGRQFISTTAGASLTDGLKLDYSFLKNYKVTLFGGGDVTYYEGYNAKDLIAGAEITGNFGSSLDLGLSYLQKWDEADLAQELLGFDAGYDLAGWLWLYNETQWNILSEQLSYELVGAKYHGEIPFTLRIEYLYSLPVFSATSIYSVFAVDEYEEVLAEATWLIKPGLQSFVRYVREIYVNFDDADVIEAGIEKLRTGKFSGYLTGIYRKDDDGQDLKGFKVRAAYRIIPEVEAGVGLHLDVLERSINYFQTDADQDETTSKRYWADVKWSLTNKINLQAKFERIESDLWDYYNRGRISLNVLF
jgi:hypothetical protein